VNGAAAFVRRLSSLFLRPWLAVALIGASLMAGCDTYHYYDVDVSFGTIPIEEASLLQVCELVVSGADSHTTTFPSTVVGLDPSKPKEKSVCPIESNWPDMGTFEFATFADSGKLTFTVNGYKGLPVSSDNLCTSGSTAIPASSQITTTGMVTMSNFDATKCPPNVTGGPTQ
jgi:hypothetical protein